MLSSFRVHDSMLFASKLVKRRDPQTESFEKRRQMRENHLFTTFADIKLRFVKGNRRCSHFKKMTFLVYRSENLK